MKCPAECGPHGEALGGYPAGCTQGGHCSEARSPRRAHMGHRAWTVRSRGARERAGDGVQGWGQDSLVWQERHRSRATCAPRAPQGQQGEVAHAERGTGVGELSHPPWTDPPHPTPGPASPWGRFCCEAPPATATQSPQTPCNLFPRIYSLIRWTLESLHTVLPSVSKIKMQINPVTQLLGPPQNAGPPTTLAARGSFEF